MKRTQTLTLFLGCLLLCFGLVACSGSRAPTGRLIIWHTWDEAEAPIIEQVLADFQRLNSNIHISVERKEYATALNDTAAIDEFAAASRAGLGPDVLIGVEGVFAHILYERGLVADLSEANIDWTLFSETTLQSVQRDGDVRIGVPLNAYTTVLFYNPSLIDQPPTTLDALQAMSEAETKVGLPTTFFGSYWGITGLGGDVFDGNALGEESEAGVTAWLEWLTAFQQTPGAVLSPDLSALTDGFARGDLALLVADSLVLASLVEQMGSEQVGVALLPGFPDSRPFSNVELMLMNSASVQTDAVALLSNFMSNSAQQRKLARSVSGRAPVNRTVSLDPTLFPQVSVIFEQNKTAVVPTTGQDDLLNLLIEPANFVYQQVLEGVITPSDGAQRLIQDVMSAGDEQE